MSVLNLRIWGPSGTSERIKLANIDLENKVQVFRWRLLETTNNIKGDIEISYCGLVLEDENTLSSYGITDGVTLHVMTKPQIPPVVSETKMSAADIIKGFRSVVLYPNFRCALQRLARPDIIDNVLKACPKLSEDPVALALLQDPELLIFLQDAEAAPAILEKHPILYEVCSHFLAQVEEAPNMNTNFESVGTGYSYSLDALSDDDEDMDSASDNAQSQNPLTRNTSFNAITAAQLAAAIANATNTQFNTNSAGVPSTSNSSSNVITNEMFSSAIQQAINYGGRGFSPSGTGNSSSSRMEDEGFDVLSRQWDAQLKQMHEMGLVDDLANIRALKAVNGDVNAAIELVLSLNDME